LGRVKAVKIVLGKVVSGAYVSKLLSEYSPPIVSDKVFMDHFLKLLMVFDSNRLSTSALNTKTVSFLVSLYVKPPRLALVYLDINGKYRVELVFPPKDKYTFYKDGLSDLLGPYMDYSPCVADKRIRGDYVPISGKYLVIGRELKEYEPRFMVMGKKQWYVYEVDGNPVPLKVSYLLSLVS